MAEVEGDKAGRNSQPVAVEISAMYRPEGTQQDNVLLRYLDAIQGKRQALMAKLVEEVGELIHNSSTATVVRCVHYQPDVEITGKAEKPRPLKPGELDSFMSQLRNQPPAH